MHNVQRFEKRNSSKLARPRFKNEYRRHKNWILFLAMKTFRKIFKVTSCGIFLCNRINYNFKQWATYIDKMRSFLFFDSLTYPQWRHDASPYINESFLPALCNIIFIFFHHKLQKRASKISKIPPRSTKMTNKRFQSQNINSPEHIERIKTLVPEHLKFYISSM